MNWEPFVESMVFWASLLIPLLGVMTAVATRLSERCGYQATCQRFFFAVMGMAAVATLVALSSGVGSWLACGTTVSIMSVAATVDFSRTPPSFEF